MFKITILGEQEHSVKSADRTKLVQVWCWRNMYLPKSGKWPSQHLYLKKNSGFHARENPKQQYLKVAMLNDASFSKKRIYLCLKPCSLDNTLNRPSSAWESFDIRQKLSKNLGVTHILNLPSVCIKLTQAGGWV